MVAANGGIGTPQQSVGFTLTAETLTAVGSYPLNGRRAGFRVNAPLASLAALPGAEGDVAEATCRMTWVRLAAGGGVERLPATVRLTLAEGTPGKAGVRIEADAGGEVLFELAEQPLQGGSITIDA